MVLYMNFSEGGAKVTFDYYSTLLDKEMVGVERSFTLPVQPIPGDIDQNRTIDPNDAIQLLFCIFFPERYTLSQNGDLNNDGALTSEDAVYLLFHANFPERYPLSS